MTYLDTKILKFSQPIRPLLMMVFVLTLFAVGVYWAYPILKPVFMSSPYLNGVIIFVFLVGIWSCFAQVIGLITSVTWLENFAGDNNEMPTKQPPRLLRSLAALLSQREKGASLGTSALQSILDLVMIRMDEGREISRYIINLLIFLGLLGTFYGLATTVPALVDTIRSLTVENGESGTAVFERLIHGLETQLGGMGTAFSSSLLGLGGSLVIGLLDLFAGQAKNRFYRELEEWLSSISQLSFDETGRIIEGSMELPGLITELADRLNETSILQANMHDELQVLTSGLGRLVASNEQAALHEDETGALPHNIPQDAETRMRLRNIDVQIAKLVNLMIEEREGKRDAVGEVFITKKGKK